MTRRTKILLAKIAVVLAIPMLIYAYSGGGQQATSPGFSGVPNEFGDCSSCHGGGSQNGSVRVNFTNGLTYTPGVPQVLYVTVADTSAFGWGFQLTARKASDTKTQAGTFTVSDDDYTVLACADAELTLQIFGTTCSSDYPLQYVEQTINGVRYGTSGAGVFQFTWTPPAASVGDIKIYVAGVAADGSGTASGDSAYAANYTLKAQAGGPTISTGGVVNGAGFQAGIASGSWVTITGSKLAGTTRSWRDSDFVNGHLPTALDGVSVLINGEHAYVEYVSPAQINVLAPQDNSTGPVDVQVTLNGVTGPPATAQLQTASPAFFLWNSKYAVTTRTDFSYVGPPDLFPGRSTPAKPGDTIILWGTGFGPTTPPAPIGLVTPAGQIYKVNNSVTVLIGEIQCVLVSKALSPGSAGLYQIAVRVPDSVGDGDQPVEVRSGGRTSPSGVSINIQH